MALVLQVNAKIDRFLHAVFTVISILYQYFINPPVEKSSFFSFCFFLPRFAGADGVSSFFAHATSKVALSASLKALAKDGTGM